MLRNLDPTTGRAKVGESDLLARANGKGNQGRAAHIDLA
jgi:hypothetical protein